MSEKFTNGHALIVGVGADLLCTVNDAEGLAKILTDEARCAYPSEQVHLLTGKKANRESVLTALNELANSTNNESTVIIYFSGPGYRVRTTMGEAFYLMTHGYDVSRLYQTAISGAEFTKKLTAISTPKILVLLDCSHAGGVGDVKGAELTKSPIPPEALELLNEGNGYALIASSKEDEKSLEGNPYSIFTAALIEALCGQGVAKRDGYVRVADLALHICETVPKRTQDRQHPILHFEHPNNFIIAFYAAGDKQPKELPFPVKTQRVSELESNSNTVFEQREPQVDTQININEMRGGFVQPAWNIKVGVTPVMGNLLMASDNSKQEKK